jgi:hypothetical protein
VIDPTAFDATMLLCDAAQEIGGKLYILGGGWTRILRAGPAVPMALAIKLLVPWNETNRRHVFRARLLNEDGTGVLTDDHQPISIEGQIEVGRPPGHRAGSHIDAALAVTIPGLQLQPGAYRWEFAVNDAALASAPFEVLAPPQ